MTPWRIAGWALALISLAMILLLSERPANADGNNILILLTCRTSGGDCRPHMQAGNLGLSECMVQSMRAGAQYVNEHPGRKVIGTICTDERRADYYLGRGQA